MSEGEPRPGVGPNHWGAKIGLVIEQVEDERLRGYVEAGPQHQQPYGVLHGGAWCSIVEEAASHGAGLLALARGQTGVLGVSNHTDFLRSHSQGRLDVDARALHAGRSQQLWEVRITRQSDGKLVARGQVRFHVLDQLPAERAGLV